SLSTSNIHGDYYRRAKMTADEELLMSTIAQVRCDPRVNEHDAAIAGWRKRSVGLRLTVRRSSAAVNPLGLRRAHWSKEASRYRCVTPYWFTRKLICYWIISTMVEAIIW